MLLSIIISVVVAELVTANIMFRPDPSESPQQPPSVKLSFGDMALTFRQKYLLKHGNLDYNAIIGQQYRWPQAVIPYFIDCSLDNLPEAVESVKKAMAQWERKTCIRFVKHTTEKYYLTFSRGTHCWGYVGKVRYSMISVGYGCEFEHVMAHEIGHVIGLYHEQNRPDRDDWVKVHWENIGQFKSAFRLINNTDPLGIDYDYASIMHYPWNAFSSNGKDTMTPIKPTHGKVPYIEISKDDIRLVSRMYNCSAIEEIQHQMRRRTRVELQQTNKLNCTDGHKECPMWKSWGHCKLSKRVFHDCPKSCNPLCGAKPYTKPPTKPTMPTHRPTVPKHYQWPNRNYLGTGTLCLDDYDRCKDWGAQGECTRNPWWMRHHCIKTCKKFGMACDDGPQKPPGKCANPLGLAWNPTGNLTIPDSAFSSGEHFSRSGWEAPGSSARLYNRDNYDTKKIGSWCAASHHPQYVQVDLGVTKTIRYIATQGRPKYYERVELFQIQYSDSPSNFKTYQESGNDKLFVGNCDYRTPVLNQFKNNITARYIRYIPIKWNWPCMRMELYGC